MHETSRSIGPSVDFDLGHGAKDLLAIGDVAADRARAAAGCLDIPDQCIERLGLSSYRDDALAPRGKAQGDRPAEAGRRAGHERYLHGVGRGRGIRQWLHRHSFLRRTGLTGEHAMPPLGDFAVATEFKS